MQRNVYQNLFGYNSRQTEFVLDAHWLEFQAKRMLPGAHLLVLQEKITDTRLSLARIICKRNMCQMLIG